MIRIPEVPVKGLGTKSGVDGYSIDPTGQRNVSFGQETTVMKKKIEKTPFNSMIDSKKNKKFQDEALFKWPGIRKFRSDFNDVNDNLPIKGSYLISLSKHFYKNLENKFEEKNAHFYMIHTINKLNSIFYELSIEILYKLHNKNSTQIAKDFKTFIDTKLDLTGLSEGKKLKIIGTHFLKFIRNEQYAMHYINYLKHGMIQKPKTFKDQVRQNDPINPLYFDIKKAKDFEHIFTDNLFMCIIEGFRFMMQPYGLLDTQREYKIDQQFGFQELTTFIFGYNRSGIVLDVNQNYLDEQSLWMGCNDEGPIYLFMHKPPNPYDFYECTTFNRIKCILINGTNLISDTQYKDNSPGKRPNYYEKMKRVFGKSNKIVKLVYNDIMGRLDKFVKRKKNRIEALNIIQNKTHKQENELIELNKLVGIVEVPIKTDIKEIYKQFKGYKIWNSLYEYTIATNKILEDSKKFWDGKYVGPGLVWKSKIVIKKVKTIFKIIDPHSENFGSKYDFLKMSGLDMSLLPKVPFHEINCVNVTEELNQVKKNNLIVCN